MEDRGGGCADSTLVLALLVPGAPELAFAVAGTALALVLQREGGELGAWLAGSWDFAKRILPVLFAGLFVTGVVLGRPGHEGLLPSAVTEIPDILERGVMMTPALAVDGEVKAVGRIPSAPELTGMLS